MADATKAKKTMKPKKHRRKTIMPLGTSGLMHLARDIETVKVMPHRSIYPILAKVLKYFEGRGFSCVKSLIR